MLTACQDLERGTSNQGPGAVTLWGGGALPFGLRSVSPGPAQTTIYGEAQIPRMAYTSLSWVFALRNQSLTHPPLASPTNKTQMFDSPLKGKIP